MATMKQLLAALHNADEGAALAGVSSGIVTQSAHVVDAILDNLPTNKRSADEVAFAAAAAKVTSVALAGHEKAGKLNPSPRSLAGHKMLATSGFAAAADQVIANLLVSYAILGLDPMADLESATCQDGKRGPIAKATGKATPGAHALRLLIGSAAREGLAFGPADLEGAWEVAQANQAAEVAKREAARAKRAGRKALAA